jgi:hypothetical protein
VRNVLTLLVLLIGLFSKVIPAGAAQSQAMGFKTLGIDNAYNFWGGPYLWLSASGNSYLQQLKPTGHGLRETRYRFRISARDAGSLNQVLSRQDPWASECVVRSEDEAMTDQVSVTMWKQTSAGLSALSCMSNSTPRSSANFKAVYGAAMALFKNSKSRVVYRGPARHWRPTGFPSANSLDAALKGK